MSTPTSDTDALATEEMLKMFEGMDISEEHLEAMPTEEDITSLELASDSGLEIHDLPSDEDVLDDSDSLASHNEHIMPLEMSESDTLEINESDEDMILPEAISENSIDAEILEVTEQPTPESELDNSTLEQDIQHVDAIEEDGLDVESLEIIDSFPEISALPEESSDTEQQEAMIETDLSENAADNDEGLSPESSPLELDAALPVADDTDDMPTVTDAMPTSVTAPTSDEMNAVVQQAVVALQDWLALRQESEEKGPQRNLAQLDCLLDVVTQQQQHLAEQLAHSQSLNIPSLAAALGTDIPSPQALGWDNHQWREKADDISSKTNQISAMNAKLRKDLEQL